MRADFYCIANYVIVHRVQLYFVNCCQFVRFELKFMLTVIKS